MKRYILPLLLLPVLAFGEAKLFQNQVIKQFPLDERSVYEIKIGPNIPTTLMFPGQISAIESANITANTENPAPVLISYVGGRSFFTVRAIQNEGQAAVNVIYHNKAYVIRFVIDKGNEPYASVTFYEDAMSGYSPTLKKRVTPETLVGLLDRAKSYHLIAMQYPEAQQQIEYSKGSTITRYNDFEVDIVEMFRFDPEDTIVFRVEMKNKTDQEIWYQNDKLAARVGQNIYYASISDASGVIPPYGEVTAYFAITGKPNGSRANLSLKNDFSIIVLRSGNEGF